MVNSVRDVNKVRSHLGYETSAKRGGRGNIGQGGVSGSFYVDESFRSNNLVEDMNSFNIILSYEYKDFSGVNGGTTQ